MRSDAASQIVDSSDALLAKLARNVIDIPHAKSAPSPPSGAIKGNYFAAWRGWHGDHACDCANVAPPLGGGRLHQELADHMPMNVGEAEAAALVLEDELRVVDAELMQDGRLKVVDVNGAGGESVLRGAERLA